MTRLVAPVWSLGRILGGTLRGVPHGQELFLYSEYSSATDGFAANVGRTTVGNVSRTTILGFNDIG